MAGKYVEYFRLLMEMRRITAVRFGNASSPPKLFTPFSLVKRRREELAAGPCAASTMMYGSASPAAAHLEPPAPLGFIRSVGQFG